MDELLTPTSETNNALIEFKLTKLCTRTKKKKKHKKLGLKDLQSLEEKTGNQKTL